MMLRPWTLSLMTLLTATTLMACGDDKGTSADETGDATMNATVAVDTTGADDGTGTEPTTGATEPTTTMTAETAADGETCTANGDCMSQACLKYRDLSDGECVAAAENGNTRVTGTVLDFVTGEPIPGAEVRAIGALTALTNPLGGTAAVMATADASGQIDAVSTMPLKEGIGVIAIVTGADYYTTATGIAAPISGNTYGPMNGNRDMWAMPSAKLTEWSGFLMTDAALGEFLPLGEKGGVVGFVRDGQGAAKAGAKVVAVKDATSAQIRYLNDDGLGFNSDATGSSGLFVIVNPGLAEGFKVEGGSFEASAGSAPNATFVMVLTEP